MAQISASAQKLEYSQKWQLKSRVTLNYFIEAAFTVISRTPFEHLLPPQISSSPHLILLPFLLTPPDPPPW